MGFFTAVGTAIGATFGNPAIGAALGGAIDGGISNKKQKKAIAEQNRIATIAAENASRPVTTTQEVDFEGTIKSARKAGFNPLTALRATGGNITGTTTRYVAPLLSSMPSRNFTDVMSDAFRGYQSFEKGRTNKIQAGLETDYLKSQIALNMKELNTVSGNQNVFNAKDGVSLNEYLNGNTRLNLQPTLGGAKSINGVPIVQGDIENDTFLDGDGFFKHHKVTGLLRLIRDHRGVIRPWPADPEEMNFFTGFVYMGAAEVDYQYKKFENWRNNVSNSLFNTKSNEQLMQKLYDDVSYKSDAIKTKTLGRAKTSEEKKFSDFMNNLTPSLQ